MSDLQSIDRLSEILFGLIMVLTFTGSLSATGIGHEDVRTMLVGALGCNVAWGLIDAVFYLMGALADKNRSLKAAWTVRKTAEPQKAYRAILSVLPPIFASLLTDVEL